MSDVFTKKVRTRVELDGYGLINTEVKDRNDKINLICQNGHQFSTNFNNYVSNNRRCSKCKKDKLGLETFDLYEIYLNSNSYKLKESKKSIKMKDKCLVNCQMSHDWHVSFSDFKSGVRCPKCNPNYREKLKQEDVDSRYNEHGYKLISKYNNCKEKIKAICPNGHVWDHYHSNFQKGERCRECYGSKSYTLEEVKNIFINNNFTPTFNNYINNKQQLTFICNVHSYYGEQSCSLHNLNRGLANCQVCYRNKFRGENSSNWNGGVSEISKVVRDYIYQYWTFPSLIKHEFKCILSGGTDNLEVHHYKKNFHVILEEVLEDLGLKGKRKISEITSDRLIEIKELTLEKHLRQGLGVPLSKKIHKLFHILYGFKNNNIYQFEEFRIRYNKDEFKDILLSKEELM